MVAGKREAGLQNKGSWPSVLDHQNCFYNTFQVQRPETLSNNCIVNITAGSQWYINFQIIEIQLLTFQSNIVAIFRDQNSFFS